MYQLSSVPVPTCEDENPEAIVSERAATTFSTDLDPQNCLFGKWTGVKIQIQARPRAKSRLFKAKTRFKHSRY
jgi:hypothetical protein